VEEIGRYKVWSYFDGSNECKAAANSTIRSGSGHTVRSYFDLAKKVAELQFRNRDHVLLFRGQQSDHLNVKGKTSLKPSLFRSFNSDSPSADHLINCFSLLKKAEQKLVRLYRREKFLGVERLKRHRVLRWAILQHYDVCATPLLDVTHSLRIATFFASQQGSSDAFVFVLGVPNISGAVTASAEAGLEIIRLASACPPAAIRPHLQEGYLLGEYPEVSDFEQKAHYHNYEIDFGRRLVAKFRFDPNNFWTSETFPMINVKAVYPSDSRDPLNELCLQIKQSINQ